jgi:hypothetical protein
MQVTREEFIEWQEPTLREVYALGFNYGDEWIKAFREEESEKRREEINEFVYPDVVVQTDEGAPYRRLNIRRGYLTNVINLEFTGEIKITQTFIEDNMYEEIYDGTYGLANAIQRKIAKDGTSQLFNGFGPVQSPDNLSLFNPAHTLLYAAAGVTSGNGGGVVPLSSAALANAIADMNQTLDENGSVDPFGIGAVQLIFPPYLRLLATQLCKSPYIPDTANNAINPFEIEPICIPQLFEAGQAGYSFQNTQWYLRDPMLARNYFFWRVHPQTRMVNDISSSSVLFQSRVRYSFLTSTWRGLWGSQG